MVRLGNTSNMTRALCFAPVALALAIALAGASGSEAKGAVHHRIALVLDPAGFEAVPRQEAAGLERAARDFGVEARIVIQPVRTSYTSTYRSLARQGYDLLIASSALQIPGALTAAGWAPKTKFALIDARAEEINVPLSANVVALAFREEQIGFAVGYLAGLVERTRPGPDVVGSVGGFQWPPVDRFIAGYRAGARRASPRVRNLNAYSGNFFDPESCERVATAQIAKGAGVVFNVAGRCGLGTLAAAKRHGVFGIGVDRDQSSLGLHVLTSALKRFDVGVYRTIELFVRGRLETGRDLFYGLREHALDLGKVSPRVPPQLVQRTRVIMGQIESGRIRGIPTTLGD